MRLTVRSLGGKLIISAALTLLLCLLLFSATSWYLLKTFYEHEAKSDATLHLARIKSAYQSQTALLTQELSDTASNTSLVAALSQPLTPSSRSQIMNVFSSTLTSPDSFAGITFISSKSHMPVEPLGDIAPDNVIPADFNPLVEAGLQGKTATFMVNSPGLDIDFTVPVHAQDGALLGALIGSQHIDNAFALDLMRISGNPNLNVVLCQAQQIAGTTIHNITLDQDGICKPDTVNIIDADQHYLTKPATVGAYAALPGSSSLLMVDIEPLYNLTMHIDRALEILIGLGIFIIALGVTTYTLIARTFFIQPIRRLQSRIAELVSVTNDVPVAHATWDELSTLERSFNLLSESLNLQENESHVITSRMSDLLAMSDILISTLNLEDLLKEIVSRLGNIMHAKSVSLLLYGRGMLS